MQIDSALLDPQNTSVHNDSNAHFNTCTEQSHDVPSYIQFAAKMYSYTDVSRTRAQSIIGDCQIFVDDVINEIKHEIIRAFESLKEKSEILNRATEILYHKISRISGIMTERQCFNAFQEAQSYIPPEEYSLGDRPEFRRGNRESKAVMMNVTGQFIPLRNVLKIFFEIPRVLEETFNYMQNLKNDREVMSNFIQGELWKDISTQFGDVSFSSIPVL